MRPRIESVTLVAKSSESSEDIAKRNEAILKKNGVTFNNDQRPFVMIFGKKLFISPKDTEFYVQQGFIVFHIEKQC